MDGKEANTPISQLKLRRSSGAPESVLHSSLTGNDAPEVFSTNAPEILHGPHEFPPEIAPGSGLEINYDGLEHVVPTKEDGPVETKRRFSKAIKLWAGLVISIVIVAAIIGGAVGGTVQSHKSSHPDSAETPPNSPPITTNSSTVTKDIIPIVLNGTSLAAASCPNGDRWVFLQDVQGNVRGCQYSVSSSNWSVLPNTTIPATAKLGSPLGASCEDIEAGLSSPNLNSGRYISVIYMNASKNSISQTTFMDGAWRDSGLIQAAAPPANDTRLSVSTNIVPSLTIGNTTRKAPAYLSSVVTYQGKNASLIVMNTDPDTQHAIFQEDNPVNPNLFDLLGGADISSGDSSTGVGFSCIYNSQHPSVNRGIEPSPSASQLYAQCSIGSQFQSLKSAIIEGTMWTYNQSSPGNGNYTVFDSPGSSTYYPPEFNRTVDIVSLAFSQDNMALLYLNSNNTIAMDIGGVDTGLTSVNPPPLPPTVPFRHIGATSGGGNSSILYVYYQANDTHFGEISFDNDNGVWSTQPVLVSVS